MSHHRSEYGRGDTRTRRLCRAVERVVASIMAEQEVLTGCSVLEVISRNSGRVVVRVGLPRVTENASLLAHIAVLRAIQGKCRSELAAAVNRKRVPTIEFEWIPSDWSEQDGKRRD